MRTGLKPSLLESRGKCIAATMTRPGEYRENVTRLRVLLILSTLLVGASIFAGCVARSEKSLHGDDSVWVGVQKSFPLGR